MTLNPYASPTSTDSAPPSGAEPPRTELSRLIGIAREVFLTWEKLRVLYIAVLAGVVLVSAVALGIGPLQLESPRVLFPIIAGAVGANVLYMAGPMVETYVRWLGYRGPWLRWAMFASGTFLSALLAIEVMLQL